MRTENAAILEALDQQVDCYRRLAKLAEIQHEHVLHNQTDALLEVLGQRQGVLERIADLESVVAPIRRMWAQFALALDESGRSRAEGLMLETRQLLEQITRADQNDALVLQQRKLNLGRQINQAQAATRVNRSYAAAAYGPAPTRMDLRR